MSNMSYYRFQNTLFDLQDCVDYMDDDDLSPEEARAREYLVEVCTKIVDNWKASHGVDMSETKTTGIGVGGLLGVAFAVLKLTGVINWSWWWVTCPFWIGFAILLLLALVVGVAFVVASLFTGKN